MQKKRILFINFLYFCQGMQNTFKFQFPTDVETLGVVEKFIEDTQHLWNISDEAYGNIMVAVSEAINNAIFHGNKLDKSKHIYFEVSHKHNMLTFKVSDEGIGFNPDELPDPTSPERILEPGGRGIFLMKALADAVEFLENGKTVVLTFDLKKEVFS